MATRSRGLMAREGARTRQRRMEEEAERRATAARSAKWRRLAVIWGVVVLVVGGLAVFMLTRPEPPGLEAVEQFPDLGVRHLAEGEPDPVYNSEPPTSGPHDLIPAPCGIYRQPVPDRNQVHNLEHGVIVIQYDPAMAEADVAQLEELARGFGDKVLVAPREGMPGPLAVTAWTHRMLLDTVDESSIEAFYNRYVGRGPEPRATCPFEVDESAG